MKLILCVCLSLLFASGFCQVKVGVQAGYNCTTFSGDDIQPVADYYYHASSQSTFNAGVISSISLANRLSLQPSLLLSGKGAKEKSGGGWSPYYYTHLRLYYVHLPVHIMYAIVSRRQLQVFAGGGFFVSKGIWGTSNTQYTRRNDSTGSSVSQVNSKVNFTNNLYNYDSDKRKVKPWDAGYTVAASACWQNWQLKATYEFGLVNMIVQNNHKSSVFSLSAGYYFLPRKKSSARSDAGK